MSNENNENIVGGKASNINAVGENSEISELAMRLKELRESCGTTTEDLAGQLGIPVETYTSYEESGLDIPISVLYKVVNIFNVNLTELLTGNTPKLDTYCVVRDGEGLNVDRYPGYKFKSVAFNFLNRKMEPLIVEVEYEDESEQKEGGSNHSNLVTHTGQEYNYVIDGYIKITLGKNEIILNPGDSCYFNPMIPHGQKAVSERARFLTVIME